MSARGAQGELGAYAVVGRLVLGRLKWALALALAVVAGSAAGYVVLEDFGWFDAIYMAVITVGTVGFAEIQPLGTAGRVWTMLVIAAGFAVFVYSSASLTALFVSGDVRAAFRRKRIFDMRRQLNDHVIVVGCGRVGGAAAEAVNRSGRRCLVIDIDPTREPEAVEIGAMFLAADARDADALVEAGITRAVALVSALDDPSNAVVALTARSLAPTLRIVTRVADVAWSGRLRRAGASQVVPVYETVGAGLAAMALDAEVLGVLPLVGTDMRVEELAVGERSWAAGQHISALMAAVDDVHVLGLRRSGGLTRWHETDGPLEASDVIVALGSPASLAQLTDLVRRDAPDEQFDG